MRRGLELVLIYDCTWFWRSIQCSIQEVYRVQGFTLGGIEVNSVGMMNRECGEAPDFSGNIVIALPRTVSESTVRIVV